MIDRSLLDAGRAKRFTMTLDRLIEKWPNYKILQKA
jgi:hypothetical protein